MTLASRGALGVVSAGAHPHFDAGTNVPACAASPKLERCTERNDMPVIKINDQQYSLRPGPNRLGAGADADVCVDDDAALGVQAIVDLGGNALAVIRRAGDADPAGGDSRGAVRVNGIVLVDPTPLIHGDKVEIAGRELQYADDTKDGATQYVSAAAIAAMAQHRPGGGRATTATGGRLVSLVDGKEYSVPDGGIVIGRDAGSDVVVALNDVSRKHAEVMPVETGYVLRDLSANGVFVNGDRVDRTQLLARSDVIRIGTEEFRFYADIAPAPGVEPQPPALDRSRVAPVDPPSAPTPPMAAPAAAAAAESTGSRGPARAAALSATMEFTQLGDARPVLASLQVINEGPSKGHIYTVHVPLAHVGRGAHNDVVIADESVSDTHAKLQHRDDGWYLVDVGSTNGTYVAGQRIAADRRLDGAPDVRFGGVKTVFRAIETAAAEPKGTRPIASIERAKARAAAQAASAHAPREQGIPRWLWIGGAVVIVIVAAVVLLMMNR